MKDYWSFLKDIFKKYLVRGFMIMRIRADLEFVTLQTLVGELPTQPTLLLAAQEENVGPVERNIRYLKEKVRLLRFTLPFTKIPKFMLIYMVFAATKVMNMFPPKGGNAYYSPGIIMTGMGVSIEELRIAFWIVCTEYEFHNASQQFGTSDERCDCVGQHGKRNRWSGATGTQHRKVTP